MLDQAKKMSSRMDDPLSAKTPPSISKASTSRGTLEPKVAQAGAYMGRVSPQQTVAGQLNKITSEDSPTMQRAKTEGMLTAGRRGLQNSSIAAGTAMGAMVDRALPIAQQDANTNAVQSQKNQDALNQTELFNTDNTVKRDTQLDLIKAQADESARLATLDNSLREGTSARLAELESNLREGTEIKLQNIRGDQAIDLMNTEAEYKERLQTSASAAAQAQQYQQTIASILSNDQMTATQITAALNNAKKAAEASFNVIGGIGGLDLSKFAFETKPANEVVNPYNLPLNIPGFG